MRVLHRAQSNLGDGLCQPDAETRQHCRCLAGSIARTAQDLVLLDSIIRNHNATTTGNGAVAEPLPCAVAVNASMGLRGVRLGLPSTFAWQTPGISLEVRSRSLPVLLSAPAHPLL